MKMECYAKLARHLDSLPGGYPSTDSGVELRMLGRLFTPEEAELEYISGWIGRKLMSLRNAQE